jgi:2-isopropylmalate synthase
VVYETPESHVWDKIVNYGEECYIFNKITGEKNTLTKCSVKSVTSGIDAVAEVIIKIKKEGRTFTGYGVDMDIIMASAKAYLSALNRRASGRLSHSLLILRNNALLSFWPWLISPHS